MNMKRMRGRNHRSGGGGAIRHNNGQVPLNRNHVFDSNGPDMRVRGTAQQLFEKYLQLGRDASSSDDRVAAEGYFQHAEHYFRIVNAMAQAAQQNQHGQGGQQNAHYNNSNQRRFADPEEGEDEADVQPRFTGNNGGGQRDGQPNRDYGNRDRNREHNRDQPRDGYRNDGQRNEGQRSEARGDGRNERSDGTYGRDRDRDQRFRQPVPQAASQAELPVQTPDDAVVELRQERVAPPVAVEPVVREVVVDPAPAAETAAVEAAPTPARAPRAPRTRRRVASAPAEPQVAEDRRSGDQPEITPATSLSAVED